MTDEKPVYGRDMKCPRCEAGLADVAPDFRFTHNPDSLVRWASADYCCTCTNGHRLWVTAFRTPPGVRVTEDGL